MKIDELHTKFFYGTISEEEKKILFDHVREVTLQGTGSPCDDFISYILMTSHPDYGKPDIDGFISII